MSISFHWETSTLCLSSKRGNISSGQNAYHDVAQQGVQRMTTPHQPLDLWMDNPFMGQQVRNCNSFTSTHNLDNVFAMHNLDNVFAMHRGPRASPLCIQHYIQLTSLSFQVNEPSHSKNMATKMLTSKIKGQGHRWGQSLKSQHVSNILSTHILLIPCQSTLLLIELFLNLIFKIKGQSHSSRSPILGRHTHCILIAGIERCSVGLGWPYTIQF